jgi:hypothetical protein
MPVLHEEFIRCSCGNADFEEKVVVTLPNQIKKRYVNELGVAHPTLEKQIHYICTGCEKRLDI